MEKLEHLFCISPSAPTIDANQPQIWIPTSQEVDSAFYFEGGFRYCEKQ